MSAEIKIIIIFDSPDGQEIINKYYVPVSTPDGENFTDACLREYSNKLTEEVGSRPNCKFKSISCTVSKSAD